MITTFNILYQAARRAGSQKAKAAMRKNNRQNRERSRIGVLDAYKRSITRFRGESRGKADRDACGAEAESVSDDQAQDANGAKCCSYSILLSFPPRSSPQTRFAWYIYQAK
jgi:hypothetical protein